MSGQLLKYRGIVFDEWTEGEDGIWAAICPDCRKKYSVESFSELDNCGSGCCSVQGCNQDASMEIDMRYIDFDSNLIEII